MPDVIRKDGIHNDDLWTLVSAPVEGESLQLPDGPALLPVTVWNENQDAFAGRNDIGVWFDSWRRATGSAILYEALRL